MTLHVAYGFFFCDSKIKHRFYLLKKFIAIVNNQFSYKIKMVRSDNGTEFMDDQLQTYVDFQGIMQEISYVDILLQDDIVEYKYRHFLEVT